MLKLKELHISTYYVSAEGCVRMPQLTDFGWQI